MHNRVCNSLCRRDVYASNFIFHLPSLVCCSAQAQRIHLLQSWFPMLYLFDLKFFVLFFFDEIYRFFFAYFWLFHVNFSPVSHHFHTEKYKF